MNAQVDEQSAVTELPLNEALRCLDDVLRVAVDLQASRLGPASLLDPWRGLHLDHVDARRLVTTPGESMKLSDGRSGMTDLLGAAFRDLPRGARLADELHLEPVDLAILLIVLAPDLDSRYERIYGYLQDDLTRRRPTTDLIANLLSRDLQERLLVCGRLGASAPLQRYALICGERVQSESLLANSWHMDDVWRSWVTGYDDGIEFSGCHWAPPAPSCLEDFPVDEAVKALLGRTMTEALRRSMPLRVLLVGPHGAGKFALARCAAAEWGQRLLVLDVRGFAAPGELRARLQRAQRTAVLFNAALYIHGVSPSGDRQLFRTLIEGIAESGCHSILASSAPLPLSQATAVPFLRLQIGLPGPESRLSLWSQSLNKYHLRHDPLDLRRIAARFAISRPQIEQAAAEAFAMAAALGRQDIDPSQLAGIVRRQCGTELEALAQRITARADLDCLVVSTEVRAQLREMCARVQIRERVGRDWADGSVHARIGGISALFVGPSGTDKTLSAEAIAGELGLDLFRVDLAGVVSKYIGETEKNLDRIFAAAENANSVLLFDEADALFGRRSEVKDARDRYANIEVAYLLQRMEQFSGLAILTTNLKQNLDDAFARRITYTVTFAFPEQAERQVLWESLWPPQAPRADDVDLAWFAREYRLSGGTIRNAVVAAAYLAAGDGEIIARRHLLHAVRREFQKLGKTLPLAAPFEGREAVSRG